MSIAHRPELERFHNRKIALERRRGGARLVTDIDLMRKVPRRRLLGRLRGRWRRKARRTHARAA
jgi:vitamin B12/bleomycin/antimicrobial peptide transport system ATP-binding/permease protein